MEINNEDTLRAIYLHEYGHVEKNHFQSKKIDGFNVHFLTRIHLTYHFLV